ncbi:hypothetical protein OAG51_02310 [Pirellulaceae bacterium]|nr:hypothetical protein [Mariniblastus sp.]MDB4671876.1 hypothetical protein [Pirellulaceae bacterium]MDB4756348.1 hypothetical protein [Mariniblastus sp.]MDB4794232.1 hypothetical protein [Pirellulaceae bacterium]
MKNKILMGLLVIAGLVSFVGCGDHNHRQSSLLGQQLLAKQKSGHGSSRRFNSPKGFNEWKSKFDQGWNS